MKSLLNGRNLIKLVLGGGAGWLASELIPSILSALNIVTPEGIQNNSLLQTIFSASKNLLGGSISLQPIIQGLMTLLGALGPVGSQLLKLFTGKKES